VTIYVDSASLDDVTAAASLGFVGGFTTNPALMAGETAEPLKHFALPLAAFPGGPAFYQPTGATVAAGSEEAQAAASLAPERVVIKLGATMDGARTAADLSADGIRCALTAAYSPAQALVAHETGCAWAIPYVDRAERQGVGGLNLVAAMAALLAQARSETCILAASLKSPAQLVDAILHGAHDVTAPLDVLRALPQHPLSNAAMREFDGAWKAAQSAR
jgi:transaldolase